MDEFESKHGFYMGGREYKNAAIRAAKDLGYGKHIIQQIMSAKDDIEIEKIMRRARHERFK